MAKLIFSHENTKEKAQKLAEKRNIASIIRLKPAGCILKPLDKEIVTRIIEKCMDAKLEV